MSVVKRDFCLGLSAARISLLAPQQHIFLSYGEQKGNFIFLGKKSSRAWDPGVEANKKTIYQYVSFTLSSQVLYAM